MPEGRSKECGMDLSLEGQAVGYRPCSVDAYGRKVSEGRVKLRKWLNKQMRIEMSDGRILLGIFLCTDRDGNVILGSCTEYINPEAWGFSDEPRMLGLVMVPGKHIVSVKHDVETTLVNDSQRPASAEQPSVNDSQRPASAEQPLDRQAAPDQADDSKTDPIECSQNPLWDPTRSDSPDPEPKPPVHIDPPPATTKTTDTVSPPSPKTGQDQTPLNNLYT